MTTEKKAEANRRNALRSTGPKTGEGALACKNNALRHGLRALQTVVPGEDPAEWEAHRAAVVEDLAPQGAVELTLAEQVAVKLWRLGRVVRHEADLITSAQDEDNLIHAHEKAHHRIGSFGGPARTDIPTREDVQNACKAAEKAREQVKTLAAALRQIKRLPGMKDEDALPDWTLCELLEKELAIPDEVMEAAFKGQDEDGPPLARSVRALLAFDGGGMAEVVANAWRGRKATAEQEARKTERKATGLARRYKAALERRRRAHGLPGPADLDRIQRYEAHLERGLHKALDRLRDLQAARGAAPPRGPSSVTLAMIHPGPEAAAGAEMGPFGSFALEATGGARGEDGAGIGGRPDP